jgi:hypothetical protein
MSTSRFRANAIEVRTIMEDAAIDGERRLGLKAGEIRLRGLQRQLEPILLLEAFTGTRRSTLRAACAWLAVAPRATLLSRSLWIALLHTAVGDGGFHALQTLRGRLRRRA